VNSQQQGTRFNGPRDIFIAEHVISGTRRRHASICALGRFDMLTKSCSRICHGLLDCLSSRETSLDVREPDAENAIRLFLDDGDIMHRHPVDTPCKSAYTIAVGWAKALARLFYTAIPIVRRAHHLNLRTMAEGGGHGARETQYAERQCRRLCPPYSTEQVPRP
jgi:hypothetical protein